MTENVEKKTVNSKLNGFLEKNRKIFTFLLVFIVLVLVCFIIGFAIGKNQREKQLSQIDTIFYELTNKSSSLEENEIESRRTKAMESLSALVNKTGIVGARANMICAELSFQKGKYDDSIKYWQATSKKAGKTYLVPLADYNLGVCYEQLGKIEEAANQYKIASEFPEFVLKSHAKFSYARILETQNKIDQAVVIYQELFDENLQDTWGKLAKTRLLSLTANGKIKE